MREKVLVSALLTSTALNIFGLYIYFATQPYVASASQIEKAQKEYPLLAKRTASDDQQVFLVNFNPLRSQIHKTVDPWGDDFGLYFEYLPTGTSIGVNSSDAFYAASLFKVPVVMAYYHGRERLHKTDDPVIEIKPEDIDKESGSLWKKGVGTKLKASEAVRLSLEQSDNTAIKALLPLIEITDFNTVYNGLDIELHSDQNGALISAHTYAAILKALHYSSVLTKNDSEEILELLSRTPFNDKIVAGVPRDIKVSHKIGDYSRDGDQGYRDCGIVYVPQRPYLICMYSKGDDQTARERMKLVSQHVYNYVSKVAQ